MPIWKTNSSLWIAPVIYAANIERKGSYLSLIVYRSS